MIVSKKKKKVLKTKLEQCKDMQMRISTGDHLNDCWFDWQQDEAHEWVDQHIKHIRCVDET